MSRNPDLCRILIDAERDRLGGMKCSSAYRQGREKILGENHSRARCARSGVFEIYGGRVQKRVVVAVALNLAPRMPRRRERSANGQVKINSTVCLVRLNYTIAGRALFSGASPADF